jgi:hypothetical protein
MRTKIKTQAIIAGISEDQGLECYSIHDRSIKSEEFKLFLHKIKELYPDDHVYLFMDNLSVHKTRAMRALYDELDLTPIFNVPYSP